MASLRETMTEAFKAMMAERKKEVPVVEESALSMEASDSAKSLKLEVAVDNTKTMKFVPENGDDNDEEADSDDPDMMPTPVVKDADKKSGPEKDRKNEKTLLDSVKSSATVVADETVKGSRSPSPNSEKTGRVKSSEKSTNTVDLARESESVDATKKKQAGSRIVKAGDCRLVTKAVPTQTKQTEDQEELQTSKKTKSTETETPTTKEEASSIASKSVTETKKSDPKESVVKTVKESTETVDNEKVTMPKERTKTNAAEESEKLKKKSTAKRSENDDGESELAKAVRAALLGEKRRVGKPKPPSRPPPWGNYNPYAARPSWPEHPPGAPTAYPYAPQQPHYGMPPPIELPGGGRFSGTAPPPFGHQPPHCPPPGAPLPMMTHMELYASTFFPGYPPHVQQLLARQASRAMGLRSQYTEVIHRDDPPLSGPPPPLPYPPHAHLGPGGYPPPHPPPIGHGPPPIGHGPPPHRDPRAHGPLPPRGPPPRGYMPNPHGHHPPPPPHHRDMYGPPPPHPMARSSRDMPNFRRFGKKPMRAPVSFRDEDAELRFVMSRLAPPNKVQTPMRMPSDDHHGHHPLLSPNAPEFTPHHTVATGRGGGDRAAKHAGRPSMADLPPPEKRSGGRPQDSHKSATADAGNRKFLSPAQTSVFTQSGKNQPRDNKAGGKRNSLSPTSPEFVPNPNVQGHDLSKANAVQTAMKITQERRASHDNQFPQETMKRDLQTPVHEKLSRKEPQRAQPYDHPPKNPSKIARGPPSSRGNGGVPHFTEVHRQMDAMSPYMPPPGFGGHLRSGHRVTPDMSRYCTPSLRSLTVKENREFDKRYRSGDRYGNWRSGPRMMKDHGAEHIQEVIDARQMVRQGPSLRDITSTASSPDLPPLGGGGKEDAGANMKSSVLAPHGNEDMISRFDTASPPFMRKNPGSYLEAVSNNKSRFGGPAHIPKHPADGSGQQDIIALAEQNISRVQKENIPPPSDPTLGHPPLAAQDRRRVTYKEARPSLRDLSRKARARHERSPENVHNHMPSDNVFVRTNGPPQALPMREVQNIPLHSPPGLPIPPHARRSSVTQTCDNARPQARAPASRESENRAHGQESRALDSTERKDGGKHGRGGMLPPPPAAAEHGGLPEMSMPPHLAARDRRASLRDTYKQAQHHQHFTPRSREIRIRDRIAVAEQERHEAAMRDEREHHSPRSMQDVRERDADRFSRDQNRGRSQEPDVSDLCEQYAIRNECRYGVDTCRYEHVNARDLTDAELDALYERRRERKAQRKRELEKYRDSDRDRYDSQREARSRRSRSPSYDDHDRRGPSRHSMRSPPRARRYNDRDLRRNDRRSGGDDADTTPGRIRATAYPMPAASSGNRSNRRSRSRSNRRDRDRTDRGGSSRPNGRSLHVRGTARPQRDQRDERERDYDRVKRDQRDRSAKDRDFGRARDLTNKSVDNQTKENKDQKESNLSESAEDGELKQQKKEKREPSREGALTDIRLAPRENRDEVCRFFGTDKPCWAAARCPFKHLGKDGRLLPTLNRGAKTESEKLEKEVNKSTADGAAGDTATKKDAQCGPEKERMSPAARVLPPALLKDLSTPKQYYTAQGMSAVNNAPPKTSENGSDKAKESKKSTSGPQK